MRSVPRRCEPSHLLVIILTLSLLDGCGSSSRVLQGSIKVDQATNPDVKGRASPIVVRVYELRSPTAFGAADFFALFDSDSETLGPDLLGREEYQLRPAETLPYQRQLQPDTQFIGVVAAFRDLENSRWRQVTAVPTKSQSTIAIGIEARAVTVTMAPPKTTNLFAKEARARSKGDLFFSKDSLLAQATDMVAELTSMSTGGKLTPEQVKQASGLISKANGLRGQLQDPGTDPMKLSELGSNLLD